MRSPSKYGCSTRPPEPGSASSARRPSSSWSTSSSRAIASSTRAALRVAMSGRKSPPASAKPATAPLASDDRAVGDGEHRAAGSDRDDDVARARVEPESGGRVVAGAGADGDARGHARQLDGLAGAIGRAEHARQDGVVAEGGDQQLTVVLAGRGSPVARAARVGSVGGQLGELRSERGGARRAVAAKSPGQPVVRQRDGRDPLGVLGLGVAQPAQLGGRERRDRHAAGAVRELLGAELGDERFGRARPTACRSRAAPGGSPRRARRARPCRAAGRRRRSRRRHPVRPRPRWRRAARPTTPRGRPRCRPDARRARCAPRHRSPHPGSRPCNSGSTSRPPRRASCRI